MPIASVDQGLSSQSSGFSVEEQVAPTDMDKVFGNLHPSYEPRGILLGG